MPATVRIKGLSEFRRALRDLSKDLPKALRQSLKRAGEEARADAEARAPRHSGRLASSVKVYAKAVSVAVGSRLIYAPVIEFGSAKKHISSEPFVAPAVDATQEKTKEIIEQELLTIAAEAGWQVT